MKKTIISSGQNIFHSIYDIPVFSGLFRYLVFRDFIIRYRNTFLGIGWSVFRPLLQIILFGSVSYLINKGRTTHTDLLHSFFDVGAGIIVWQLISSITTEGSNALLQNSSIISKIYFPRIILPLASSILPLVDFIITFLIFILIALFTNYPIHFHILYFTISILILFMLSLSFSIFLSVMNVFFRDIKLLLPYVLQVVFFSLPIFIDIEILRSELFSHYPIVEKIYFLNPLAYPVLLFKKTLLSSNLDADIFKLLYSFIGGLILLVFSAFYFQKKERLIVEYF
ncbi:MAG: ABC transporter permease [Bacteroidia bacterium]|nr:ABC transporter permease [Bacteroidia bacterium]